MSIYIARHPYMAVSSIRILAHPCVTAALTGSAERTAVRAVKLQRDYIRALSLWCSCRTERVSQLGAPRALSWRTQKCQHGGGAQRLAWRHQHQHDGQVAQ